MKTSTNAVLRNLGNLAWLIALSLVVASCERVPTSQPQLVSPKIPTLTAKFSAPTIDRIIRTDARTIEAIQRDLNQLGYDAGGPDGIGGPATRHAIMEFQEDHGLVDDGRFTVALADAVEASLAQLSKGVPITVEAGDRLVYSDGSVETVENERAVNWGEEEDDGRLLVAVRPSTSDWPPAARAGLDWATTHALDVASSDRPIPWSRAVDFHTSP